MEQFLIPKAVCQRTSLSRSTLERMVAAGEFPRPIRLTERRIAFRASDIDAWMLARIEAQRAA